MPPVVSIALLRTQSDDRLVALARDGHEAAFEAIVERYRKPLLRACRRVLPESRAEDALQQAFLSAWTALRRGDEVRDLRPWLYRIAHNMSLNALRASGYDYDELKDSLSIVSHSPGDEAERRAVIRQTLAAVAALPDRQREALLRTAFDGTPQEQLAAELGLSNGAVRQLVHRARVQLRAAATVVTPLPLVVWAAGGRLGGDSQLTHRIAELVAGAAPAGAAMAVAKAGAVVAGAGLLVGGPVIAIERSADSDRRPVERAAAVAVERSEEPGGQQRGRPVGLVPTPEPSPQVAETSDNGEIGDRRGGERNARARDAILTAQERTRRRQAGRTEREQRREEAATRGEDAASSDSTVLGESGESGRKDKAGKGEREAADSRSPSRPDRGSSSKGRGSSSRGRGGSSGTDNRSPSGNDRGSRGNPSSGTDRPKDKEQEGGEKPRKPAPVASEPVEETVEDVRSGSSSSGQGSSGGSGSSSSGGSSPGSSGGGDGDQSRKDRSGGERKSSSNGDKSPRGLLDDQ